MGQPFRIMPKLPAGSMKTYQISAPISTHRRPATCREADCQAYLNGWTTSVDETTELGAAQAYYIRHDSGRRFTEERTIGLTVFRFEAGQTCFLPAPPGQPSTHRHSVPLERTPLFVVREGDWRGNPRGIEPRILGADDWVDDFANHQNKLAEARERG
jgi:hypothetical protein